MAYEWMNKPNKRNKLTRLRSVNDNLQKIRLSNRKTNCVRYNINNTNEHELKKAEVCLGLQRRGHSYISEAMFGDGSGTADVYDLDDNVVYEILYSETDKRFSAKNYPVEKIVPIYVIKED